MKSLSLSFEYVKKKVGRKVGKGGVNHGTHGKWRSGGVSEWRSGGVDIFQHGDTKARRNVAYSTILSPKLQAAEAIQADHTGSPKSLPGYPTVSLSLAVLRFYQGMESGVHTPTMQTRCSFVVSLGTVFHLGI